jgi:hypothetical protein
MKYKKKVMKIQIKNGAIIEVYKHSSRAVYVNSKDCITEYKVNEVKIISK